MPTHGLRVRQSDLQVLAYLMDWDNFGILGLGKSVGTSFLGVFLGHFEAISGPFSPNQKSPRKRLETPSWVGDNLGANANPLWYKSCYKKGIFHTDR